jgi:hypothetical protein
MVPTLELAVGAAGNKDHRYQRHQVGDRYQKSYHGVRIAVESDFTSCGTQELGVYVPTNIPK